MSDLAEACAAIAAWLPEARALLAEPDIDGTAGGGEPGSCPPWNPAAAAAALDAHEGVRRLEASMHRDVFGELGRRRGGSDEATMEAIKAVENLGHAVTTRAAAKAAHILDLWTRHIRELPAIDQSEPWRRLRVPCPYCGFAMLRVRPRSGEITCLRYGACTDTDGQHPKGTMEAGRLGWQVRWNDGLVAP